MDLQTRAEQLKQQHRELHRALDQFMVEVDAATMGERKEACIGLGLRRTVADDYVKNERTGAFRSFLQLHVLNFENETSTEPENFTETWKNPNRI